MKKVVSGRPAMTCMKATARTGPPDTTFFISQSRCVPVSQSDRWITCTIEPGFDLSATQQPGSTSARELTESEALDWLAARGFEVPRRLQGRGPAGGSDSTDALTPERLMPPMRSLLAALRDLQAFSPTSARSQSEVLEMAGLSSLYTRAVRTARVKLRDEGLLGTQAGPSGGTWIAPRVLEFLSH